MMSNRKRLHYASLSIKTTSKLVHFQDILHLYLLMMICDDDYGILDEVWLYLRVGVWRFLGNSIVCTCTLS